MSDFKTLLPYLKKYRLSYGAGLMFLILTNAAQLAVPQIVKRALDAPGTTQDLLWYLGLTALTVALGRVGWRYFIIGSARRIEMDLRQRLFDHLTKLSAAFYGRNRTGDLLARATSDLDAVRMGAGMALVALVDGVFLSGSIMVILISSDPMLGILTILPLPLITILLLSFGGRVGRLFKEVQESNSNLTHQVQEYIGASRVIQSFRREEYFLKQFAAENQNYLDKNLKLTRLWGLFFPLMGLLSGLTTLVLLWVGGQKVMNGELSPGDFAAWIGYLGMLVWPMLGAGMTVNILQRAAASLKRINSTLAEVPEITSPTEISQPDSKVLEVKNLSYRHPNQEKDTLCGISFTLEPGKTLGILGSTGSGKSTLLQILPRLLDPPPGTVFLGGQDIRNLDLSRVRQEFSLVPQNTFLFSQSIRNNINFSVPPQSPDRAEELGELASLSKDVERLQEKWDTQVGERGITLSGGQKQRISLARALGAQASILLLDDAMSALDTESEARVLGHLETARGDQSMILVSHRISTLKKAHEILVLSAGQIAERGTHQELMALGGIYHGTAVLQHETGGQK